MKLLRKLTMATESIRFQNDVLFRDLIALFATYVGRGAVPSKSEREALFTAVQSVIKKRTNITMVPEPGYGYAVSIPDWNEGHVLAGNWKPFLDGQQSHVLIKQGAKVIKGSVDLEKAWVEGFYADHKFRLLVDLESFTDQRFDARHHAGAVIHELGHAFTFCEMLDRVVETNQVLSRLVAEIHQVDAAKRKVEIVKAGKALKLSDETVSAAAESNNTEVITTILLTGTLKEGGHNTRSPYYNLNSAEQMADDFAARMGAGAAVVEFLHIYGEMGKSVQTRSSVTYLVIEFIKMALTVLSLPLGAYWMFIGGLVWVVAESSDTGGTYDTPAARYKRVRAQIVEAMKNFNLSSEMNRKYQEQLELLDAIIAQYTDRQQFWGVIFDYVFSAKAIKDKQYQQELEALAANELFIGAQLLKHL